MANDTLPVLSVNPARAAEGDYIVFTVQLSAPSTERVTVDYLPLAGTALAGTDINNAYVPIRLVFEPGEEIKALQVYAVPDALAETDESFGLRFFNPDGIRFGEGLDSLSTLGWVLDNDGAEADRALAISAPAVAENGNTAVFTLSLSEAFGADRSFSFATFDGSARAGADYTARTGTVTFAAGQTEARVTVDLTDDGTAEATESFGLRVAGAHGVAGAAAPAQVEDEDAAQPVISFEGARAQEGEYITVLARLSAPATETVTVAYRTAAGTAALGTDLETSLGTLSFAPGQTVRSFRIATTDDTRAEIDESFGIELFSPSGATFGPGQTVLRNTGWVLDADGTGPDTSLAISAPVVAEQTAAGAGVAVFTLSLSRPLAEAVTFDATLTGGTATAGVDFEEAIGPVTFAAGQTQAQLAVALRPDTASEASETFTLSLAPPWPAGLAAATTARVATATILDGSILGGKTDDRLRGTPLADRIQGGDGNDHLTGGAGDDLLYGNDGRDRLEGEAGRDRMEGGAGDDTFVVDSRRDTVVEATDAGTDRVESLVDWALGAGLETLILTGGRDLTGQGNGGLNRLTGNGANNNLHGWGGDDRLWGGAGRDWLDGGTGRDRLAGEAGNDTFVVDSRRDTVVEAAGAGTDTVRSLVDWVLGDHVEALVLTGARDLAGTGNALDNRITGNGGDNSLNGGSGDDRLWGGAGGDRLEGGTGRDRLAGEAGDDTYVVDSRRDTVVEAADAGTDTVESLVDWVLGDHVEALVLTGARGLAGRGNTLNNRVTGTQSGDSLKGRDGDDRLWGGEGRDRIWGDGGDDRIGGDGGDDWLKGGAGADRIGGGAGADRFVFSTLAETGTGAGRDTITDFAAEDRIDLSGLDADATRNGDQAFDFIGAAGFGAAGQLRFADGLLSGDGDGDGTADLEIALSGLARLDEGSLLL